MVANPAKFQVMFLGTNDPNLGLNIDGKIISNSSEVKLLGVILDNKLSFLPHIKDICSKATRKTKALLRIRNYLNDKTAKLLCNSFILSNFNYCPLIWMFSNKEGNALLNATHKRALRAQLNNFSISFNDMLQITDQKTIHNKNLAYLAIDVYKSINSINPQFINELFSFKTSYTFRRGKLLNLPPYTSVDSWLHRSILAWNNLPRELKESKSVTLFKKELVKHSLYCKCKTCR